MKSKGLLIAAAIYGYAGLHGQAHAFGGTVSTGQFMAACLEAPSQQFCLSYVIGVYDASPQTSCFDLQGSKSKLDLVKDATSGILEIRRLVEDHSIIDDDSAASLSIIWGWEHQIIGWQEEKRQEYNNCVQKTLSLMMDMKY